MDRRDRVRAMIAKILLTLSVIAIAWLVIRQRQRRQAVIASQPPPRVIQTAANGYWRWAGYLLVIMMILGSGLFLYQAWQDHYRVVSVLVIDTLSGNTTQYQARRGDVEARRFITLDGREVSVAGNERIELQAATDRP
jgi:ABC-type Fe3+ transport system permease subunit